MIAAAGMPLVALLQTTGHARTPKNDVVELVSPGWRAGKMERLPVEAVRRWGGDPAIEREYGVQFLEHQVFSQVGGGGGADVVAERAADPSSVLGLRGMFGFMFRGQQFIRMVFMPPDVGFAGMLRAMMSALGAQSPPTEDMKALPAPLPAAGLVPGSEKYLLGLEAARRILPSVPADLFGFNLGAEITTGEYSAGKSQATVAVITYPTPQIAHSLYDRMQKRLDLNQGGSAFGKQEGSFVVLVLNSESPSTAAHLMGLFRRHIAVSWDKPYLGDKPPLVQMLEFIVQNLIFVFYLCGWSVVGGQHDDATIITLNLS
ncbi:MAG: hypothetical protein DMG21_13925 [Acidobacteria bacterium]|nr:MAG: hypothetical protein DMG21_13925 [Acidobacteriota bacterium]